MNNTMAPGNFAFGFNNSHFSDRRLLFQVSASLPMIVYPHCEESAPMENELEDGERDHVVQVNEDDRESLDGEMYDECSESFPEEVDEERLHVDMEEGNGQDERLLLHVNSLILASHSEYFMSLFCNGMSESSSEVVVIQVTEEERLGLISLIEYMYTGHLKDPSSTEAAIMLLCLADRFAMHSSMAPLVQILESYPKTPHDCHLVLSLPESLRSNKTVRPLVESCCKYLSERFRDISTLSHRSELLSLSMEVFKVVLGSELLEVQFEEEVFFCLSDWIKANYNDAASQALAASNLSEMVRFPWLTGDFLEDVVSGNPLMQSNACQTLVMEALRFRSYSQARQQCLMRENTPHNRFRPRNKLILENFWGSCKTYVQRRTGTSCQAHFEFPLEMVIHKSESFLSRTLTLGPEFKHNFFLRATRTTIFPATCRLELMYAINPMWSRGSCEESYSHTRLEYTISIRRRSSQEYDSTHTGHCDLEASHGTCARFDDLFSGSLSTCTQWDSLTNGPIFINLDLHLCSKPDVA